MIIMFAEIIKTLKTASRKGKNIILMLGAFILTLLPLIIYADVYQANENMRRELLNNYVSIVSKYKKFNDFENSSIPLTIRYRFEYFFCTSALTRSSSIYYKSTLFFSNNGSFSLPLDLFDSKDLFFVFFEVLSLFALLLSYDSFSAEYELGQIKLLFSQPLKRGEIFLNRCISVIVMLLIFIGLPVFVAILFEDIFCKGVLTGVVFLKLMILFAGAFGTWVFFSLLGFLFSVLYKRSIFSLLSVLSLWFLFFVAIPTLWQDVNQKALNGLYRDFQNDLLTYEKNYIFRFKNNVAKNSAFLGSSDFKDIKDIKKAGQKMEKGILLGRINNNKEYVGEVRNLYMSFINRTRRFYKKRAYMFWLCPVYPFKDLYSRIIGTSFENFLDLQLQKLEYVVWFFNYYSKKAIEEHVSWFAGSFGAKDSFDPGTLHIFKYREKKFYTFNDIVDVLLVYFVWYSLIILLINFLMVRMNIAE